MVGKLELVIGVVLHIIFIFFYLMVFNVSACTTPVQQLLPMLQGCKASCSCHSCCNHADDVNRNRDLTL